jgi:hypothetical protein
MLGLGLMNSSQNPCFSQHVLPLPKNGEIRGEMMFFCIQRYPLRDVAKLQGDSHLCSGSGSDHSTGGSGVGKKT